MRRIVSIRPVAHGRYQVEGQTPAIERAVAARVVREALKRGARKITVEAEP